VFLQAALMPITFSLTAFMAPSKSSCFHQPLLSFFSLYVVGMSLKRKISLNFSFILYPAAPPFVTKIQHTCLENGEHKEVTPLHTQAFIS
jgi:hypothetical protein